MRYKHFKENNQQLTYVSALVLARDFNARASNVYEKSIPLLADPTLYNEGQAAQQFVSLLEATQAKNSSMEQNHPVPTWMQSDEFRLWMQGRQLLIAVNAGKVAQAEHIARAMQDKLQPAVYMPEKYNGNSVFACWALGYLHAYYALQKAPYYKLHVKQLTDAVAYQRARYDALTGAAKAGFFSDVIWSYAMAIQATALANDKERYENYVTELATLIQPTGTPAMSIRALADDQFPAWLASIVHGAMLVMHDPNIAAMKMMKMVVDLARMRSTKQEDKMLSATTEHYYQELCQRSNAMGDMRVAGV